MFRSVLAFGLAISTVVAPAAQAPALSTVALPATITFPEGVAYDPASDVAYTASAVTGTVVRVNLKTRAAETVAPAGTLLAPGAPAPFPAVLGMKLDTAHRLWIAGGATGRMWIL